MLSAADLADLCEEYAVRLRRRADEVARLEDRINALMTTNQQLHHDVELWRRALVSATGEPNARALGAIYPQVRDA